MNDGGDSFAVGELLRARELLLLEHRSTGAQRVVQKCWDLGTEEVENERV